MSSAPFNNNLMSRLPLVRGRLTENAPLAHLTWFRVGGPAEILFKPADLEDLKDFLIGCPDDVPITVIGVSSNLIVRDGGIGGVVIRLVKSFCEIETNLNNQTLQVGAGALDLNVALTSARVGLSGLEFFSGIPGTIGGALRMNAGAYGSETADVLIVADAVDRDGQMHHLTAKDMLMGYRHNDAPAELIFVGAQFKATGLDDPIQIEKRIKSIKKTREKSQPITEKTGGSTFANPSMENPEIDKSAWQLIDAAGCRGLKLGGAQISEKHCNFMINTGDATAADLERLGETVRDRVRAHSGIELRWEIRRIGIPFDKDLDLINPAFVGVA